MHALTAKDTQRKSGIARLNKTGKLKLRARVHYAQKGFPTQTVTSKRVTIRR